MFFQWNARTFGWMLEASAYTGYHCDLARLLLKYIPGGTLCDIGCGMGLVDFELAGHLHEITCVDISPAAVDFINGRAQALGVENISALCVDGSELAGQWDTVMALFHGTVETVCEKYLRLARDRLILVTHGSGEGSTGPEGYRVRKCCDVAGTAAWLDGNGYRYRLEEETLEFGQPHRNFEEAVDFARTFSRNAPEDALLEYVRSSVVETGREDFPLYTPKKRSFGIFVIGRTENAGASPFSVGGKFKI